MSFPSSAGFRVPSTGASTNAIPCRWATSMQRSVASIPIVPIWAQTASAPSAGRTASATSSVGPASASIVTTTSAPSTACSGRSVDRRAVRLERAGAVGRAVPDAHGQAGAGDVRRHRRAHRAGPEERDGQRRAAHAGALARWRQCSGRAGCSRKATWSSAPARGDAVPDALQRVLLRVGVERDLEDADLVGLGDRCTGQGGRELPARVLGGDAAVEDEQADGAASGHQRGVVGSWAMVRATLPGLVPVETRPGPMRWRAAAKRACQPLNGRERRWNDHFVP